jgi:hypothetical protein
LFVTWGRLMINSVSFFVMAPLNLGQTVYPEALGTSCLHVLHHSFSMSLHSNLADAEFATDLLIQVFPAAYQSVGGEGSIGIGRVRSRTCGCGSKWHSPCRDKQFEEARMKTLQQMIGKVAEGFARTRSGDPKFRFVLTM